MTEMPELPPRRRTVLRGAALAGVAGTALTACGSSGGDDSATPAAPVELGPASEVPVGGGKIYGEPKLVVTQPTAGQYKAFSAVCTHRGCLVSSVAEDTIVCACHNSRFSAVDGSVTSGPATLPLPAAEVRSEDGTLTAGPPA